MTRDEWDEWPDEDDVGEEDDVEQQDRLDRARDVREALR